MIKPITQTNSQDFLDNEQAIGHALGQMKSILNLNRWGTWQKCFDGLKTAFS